MQKILLILAFFMIKTSVAQNVAGFREVVVLVQNMDAQIQFYQEVGGYSFQYRGRADPSLNKLWALPKDQYIEEAFLINRGDSTGFIRLVHIGGISDQQLMRPSVQCWDTGGIFDFDVRVKNIEQTYQKMIRYGWLPASLPHRYQFGQFDVSEILMRGPDGVALALIQRHKPELVGWPNLRDFSYVFNASQIVKDFEGAIDFYQQKLDFKIYMQTEALSSEPELNILGIPRNFVQKIKRKVAILSPQGDNVGSVELINIAGFEGEDFSQRTKPQNFGIFALRFPVKNLVAYQQELTKRGVVTSAIEEVLMRPYNKTKAMVVRSPEGAWLEFFEEIK